MRSRMTSATPDPTNLVLVGGGHAHLFVLRAFGLDPLPGVRLTLIAKEAHAAYSGMLPGVLAGTYRPEDGQIDLARLADFAGAAFVHDEALTLDREARAVVTREGARFPYDILSIDVGIVPDVAAIEGARENALLVKPISRLLSRWQDEAGRDRGDAAPSGAVVIGGGPAGFELAFALRRRFSGLSPSRGNRQTALTLVSGPHLLSGLPKRARHLARRALAEADIALVEGPPAKAVARDRVELEDERSLASSLTLVATAARPPAFLRESGLAVDEKGYLKVSPTLQVEGSPTVFAAGDCVTLLGQERPKAGVFAVREGAVLADNLRRALTGRNLRHYRAQSRFLVILTLGNGEAIAARNGVAIRSRLAWWWKDRIDRSFVHQFGGGLPERPPEDAS
ncbi:FAD-dependent oxidoreductase [Aurantimonas sp. VKM B-3413]|uniref:FAD-dependent oxidoreductase n=1 Tax=Aurantimonas sp. VKM B-3413 TaxID=2779401 RepID=UPI001E65B5E0|nr:FAD-dependent oxidoreductase [Aurantimonas sp. VKM B-3413]MCB8837563.1 FAD-dependent oxidoreductase [Aurantimonas sp. VKM B-3413]